MSVTNAVAVPAFGVRGSRNAPKKGEKPDKKLVIMYIPDGIVRRQFFRCRKSGGNTGIHRRLWIDKEQQRFKNEPGVYDLEWTPTLQR